MTPLLGGQRFAHDLVVSHNWLRRLTARLLPPSPPILPKAEVGADTSAKCGISLVCQRRRWSSSPPFIELLTHHSSLHTRITN